MEEAGIEPTRRARLDLLMAHDFGFYEMRTIELPRRCLSPRAPLSLVQSPGVLPSRGDIVETLRPHAELVDLNMLASAQTIYLLRLVSLYAIVLAYGKKTILAQAY